MVSVIEQCQVVPSLGSAAELTLTLTYFDLLWLTFHRMRRILFYKFPISKTNFVKTVIPNIKHSLSLTLKHYLPLAGNIVCPLNSRDYPELRYVMGDSVSVTFSETDMDFNYLIGNHPRSAKDFYPLVPHLADPKDAPGVQLAPVLAIQVTLFPNHGISFGFTNHHVAGDGATIVWFIKAWALLNKFDGDEQLLTDHELIPFYDRSIVKDPYGQGMSIWNLMKKDHMLEMCDVVTPPQDKVRATFIITRDDIEKFKNLILLKQSSVTHVTSFVVTCAYIWTCLKHSEAAIGEEMNENEIEFFGFAADCRARLDPPLPPTYFGNCIVGYIAKTRHADLVGKESFTIAVELIRDVIQKRMKDEEYILTGEWLKQYIAIIGHKSISIAGSPKFDLYTADFGWGRPEKIEFVSIDSGNSGSGISISLIKSRNSEGDLEVGLSLPKTQMNAFAAIFSHGLSML